VRFADIQVIGISAVAILADLGKSRNSSGMATGIHVEAFFASRTHHHIFGQFHGPKVWC
jgi:hypothetical protein